MSQAELIPVNIAVADRTYRILVDPREEERVRKTVKVINDKVIEFKTHFAGKDMQDYVSMVLLWYATQEGQGPDQEASLQEVGQRLRQVEQLLEKTLDS